MLGFLNEEYAKVPHLPHFNDAYTDTLLQSEQELTLAFYHCHVGAHGNQE